MLKVHKADGMTLRFNLEDEQEAKAWLDCCKDPMFQAQISGLTVAQKGVQYSLPRPQGFLRQFFQAEYVQPTPDGKVKGGERLICVADDSRIILMVHLAQRAARFAVCKVGKQRYNPLLDQMDE